MTKKPRVRTLMDSTHESEAQLKSAYNGQHSTQGSKTQLKSAPQFFLIFVDNSDKKSDQRILFY